MQQLPSGTNVSLGGQTRADGKAQTAVAVQHGAREQRLPGAVGPFDERVRGGVAVAQADAQQIQRMRSNDLESLVVVNPRRRAAG